MDAVDSDLLFIDVDASTPIVKEELEVFEIEPPPNITSSVSRKRSSKDLNTASSKTAGNAKTRVPSTEQVLYLIERLEKMPEIAKGCLRTLAGRQRARRIWDHMRARLNCIDGTKKTSNQWMKYWSDKKKKVTSKAASGQAELTSLEEKILYLSVGGVRKSRRDSEVAQGAEPDQVQLLDDVEPPYSPEEFPSSLAAPPGDNNCTNPKTQIQPQQSQFERILNVEERRLSLEQSNAQLMRTILEQSARRERTILDAVNQLNERMSERNERDAIMAAALKTLGDGLLALSKAVKNNK